MKIINQSARTFIVRADEVLKGGAKSPNKDEKHIVPGKTSVEVNKRLGKFLKTYEGIIVVEDPDEEEDEESSVAKRTSSKGK